MKNRKARTPKECGLFHLRTHRTARDAKRQGMRHKQKDRYLGLETEAPAAIHG
jgi:hypothetical protein